MRKINEIIIHCSDTQEGKDVTAADIRRWHTTPKEKGGRGWRDIGYHFVIDIDGKIEIGRQVSQVGAHCIGRKGEDHNSHSVGICYVGGRRVEKGGKWRWADTRTPKQEESLKIVCGVMLMFFGLTPDSIHGHNDFAAKACPCFDVHQWVKDEFEPWWQENKRDIEWVGMMVSLETFKKKLNF